MLTVTAGATWSSTGPQGGLPLEGLGRVGDLTYKTTWPGGFLTASFEMNLPRNFVHPALRQNSLCVLKEAGLPIGYGSMVEPNRDAWTFVIDGPQLLLRKCIALDASYEPTTNLTTAITQAAARGWRIRVGTGVPNVALSTVSEDQVQGNTLPELLDAYCESIGGRWWIDTSGAINIDTDPAAGDIDWVLTPGVPSMATVTDDYASLAVIRYGDGVTGAEVTSWAPEHAEDTAAAARWGPSEVYEDLSNLGLLVDPPGAAEIVLAAHKARPWFSEGVEPYLYQLTTPGGTPVHPTLVRAGQRVLHQGVRASDGSLTAANTQEWVIGSTEYRRGARTIALDPVDIAAVTQAQVTSQLQRTVSPRFR